MAHAIGALGSSIELRSKAKPKMTREQRERNMKLVPRRNQTRDIAFITISRNGEKPKVRAIRAGHVYHYKQAYWYANVEVVKNEKGRPVIVKRK